MIGRRPLGLRGLTLLSGRVALVTAVIAATAMMVAALAGARGGFLFDFRGDLYGAGTAILHGHNPFEPRILAAMAALKHAGASVNTTFALPVYPAPALLAFTPLSLLPFWLAGTVILCGSIAALLLALRLLGVRDWRCYVLALVAWPTMFSIYLGSLGPLLLLGVALIWRTRESVFAPAVALSAIVIAKLFPWPLAVWLAIRRRWGTLALAMAIGSVVTVGAWAIIGFAGMTEYPRMLANLSFVEEGAGPSLVAVLMKLGLSETASRAAALTAAGALLLAAWRISRRSGGERGGFGLVVIAALTASPLVWSHYLVLLFVPIALLSPSLSWLWFVPLATCLLPSPSAASAAQMGYYLALEALVAGALLWPLPRAISIPIAPGVGARVVPLRIGA